MVTGHPRFQRIHIGFKITSNDRCWSSLQFCQRNPIYLALNFSFSLPRCSSLRF